MERRGEGGDDVVERARRDFDAEGGALIRAVDGDDVEAQIVAERTVQRAPACRGRRAWNGHIERDERNDLMGPA